MASEKHVEHVYVCAWAQSGEFISHHVVKFIQSLLAKVSQELVNYHIIVKIGWASHSLLFKHKVYLATPVILRQRNPVLAISHIH